MLRFAITDRRLGAAAMPEAELQQRLIAQCAALAAQGVDYLLLREKDLSARDLAQLARRVLTAPMKLLIPSRPDIALAVNAHGVHLTAAPGELTPAQVRRIMPSAFVSISCHTLEEVTRARDQNASAILFGPIFGKTIDGAEVTSGLGLKALHQACTQAGDTPVYALGGITQANSAACLSAGASGLAAIRLFFNPEI